MVVPPGRFARVAAGVLERAMSPSLLRSLLLGPLLLVMASCTNAAEGPASAGTGAAPAGSPKPAAPAPAPAPTAASTDLPITQGAPAATQDFKTWVAAFKAEAEAKGIGRDTLDAAFKGVAPIPRVIELDRRQPEKVMTFAEYQAKVVNDARIAKGRALYAENKTLLDEVSARYGVSPAIIVALWGVESDFGRIQGKFNVVASLATLAYDGRRAKFFRGELMNAVTILDEDHMPVGELTGSWAGAMGQCQFMPSSFLRYAVDWNGDGRRDIWTTRADVFASAANYLAEAGWKRGQPWGRAVRVPAGFDTKLASMDVRKSAAEWAKLGVTAPSGQPLAQAGGGGLSLVLPAGGTTPAYLVGDNYRAIMRWNKSTYFAVAVGTIADRIMAD
jgi:membrane-bound lytic murein transglycosylase B